MQGKKIIYASLTIWFCLLLIPSMAAVRLPKIFGSNMVLQRDKPVQVWGWAEKGEAVTVTFNKQVLETRADKKGKWSLSFPEMSAGGPYEMKVTGENEIILSNLLVGDVWICGGQSNMQWRIDQTGYEEADTAWIRDAPIRLFTVHTNMDYMPKDDLSGSGWQELSRENINAFSAVGYHFGRYINQELDVPIGLVSDNLGATSIETWMSNEALMAFPQFEKVIGDIVRAGKSFDALNSDFEKLKPRWYDKHYFKGIGVDEKWYQPETDLRDWKPIKVAGNTWEDEPDLKDHDGAVWFRTSFDLPEGYTQGSFHLGLAQIDDYDIVWVNGEKVGESYGRHNHRNYGIPTEILKPRANVLVVRVFDTGGIGGFTTSPFWGNDILRGDWLYKKGSAVNAKKFQGVELPNATPFSSPTVLYNANIAPLTPLAIKGVIWYQGESNADRAYEYRTLFPALINDWRTQFDQGDFPFLFVQLANYMQEPLEPKEDAWAALREAQAMALVLPNTGMATAIDIGEAGDIHPKNKADVGKRLALAALKVAYGQDVVASGPTFEAMSVEENKVVIRFGNTGGGLISKDKHGYVRGFQIAGSDQKFYWAKAFIDGENVILTSEEVKDPVAVRYAWSSNPGKLDLYNAEGLPALPFRTDTWKGLTEGKVFVEGPRF